jgi:5'-AMP-activated protein kinase regulatory beta subunit
MGSEGSKSNSEKIEEGNGNEGSTLDFTAYIRDNLSNYEGIRSDDENIEEENEYEDTNENQNNSSSSSSSIKDEEKDNSNEKIPTTFQWKEGGNTVYVTGSFCGWQQFFIMSKNEDGNFSLTLPLPKGIIQYKFKVDEEWKYSTQFPTIEDGGNVNNIIDNSIYSVKKEKDKKEKKQNVNNNSHKKFVKDGKLVKQLEFKQMYPVKSDWNSDARPIPQQYFNSFNLDFNTRQNTFGKKQFLYKENTTLLSENNSYKGILDLPLVNLNHMHSKNMLRSASALSATTARVRSKFTTYIYYRPSGA